MASVVQSGPVFLHQLHVGHGEVLFSFIFGWKLHCEVRKENATGATQLSPAPHRRGAAEVPCGRVLTFQGRPMPKHEPQMDLLHVLDGDRHLRRQKAESEDQEIHCPPQSPRPPKGSLTVSLRVPQADLLPMRQA